MTLTEKEMQSIRGNDISMIFQDPMTSLNPVLQIGTQLTEGMRLHMGLSKKEATDRAVELLGGGGHARPSAAAQGLPAPVLRRACASA